MDYKLNQEWDEAIEKAASEVLKRHGFPYGALTCHLSIDGVVKFSSAMLVSGTVDLTKGGGSGGSNYGVLTGSGGGHVIIGAGGAGDNKCSGVARGYGGNHHAIDTSAGGKSSSEND